MSLSKPRKIEIFVVGGLIFGLWFVLYFSFERARNIQRGVACRGNLRVIALASKQYERDFDEHFPLSHNWATALMLYHKKPVGFHCPAATKNGYAVNEHLHARTHPQLYTENIQQIPQYFETQELRDNASGASTAWLAKSRHPQGVGIVFLDGHFEWLQSPPQFRSFTPPKTKAKTKPKNQSPKGKTKKIN